MPATKDEGNNRNTQDEMRRAAHTVFVHLDNGEIREVPAVLHIHVTGLHVVLEREDLEPILIPRGTVFYAGCDHIRPPVLS